MILTVTNTLENAVTTGLQAAFALVAISWVIGLIILIVTVAIITWVVKKVWYAGSKRKEQKQRKQSYKQITVYQPKATGHMKNGTLYSPTGWKWDEDAKIWIPPEKK